MHFVKLKYFFLQSDENVKFDAMYDIDNITHWNFLLLLLFSLPPFSLVGVPGETW